MRALETNGRGLARTAARVRFERGLRRIRDGLMIGAVMWCGLALLFAFTLEPVLGFIVTIGAWVGLAAAAVFVALNVIIVALEVRIARELSRASGPEAMRLLLEELDTDDDLSRRAVIRTLLRVLPGIAELDKQERELAHMRLRSLDARREPALMIALLSLLARGGDRTSLSCAYEILEVPALARSEKRVQQAAQECVASIECRLEGRSDDQYLMRPSPPPSAPPQGAAAPGAG